MRAIIISVVVKFIEALLLNLAVDETMDYVNEFLSCLNGILF